MNSIKKNIISGSFWFVGGQLISLVISLATNIWLARLLTPKEFGQIGIVMFFIILSNIFSEGGLAGALVRKKNASKIDYSTVFVFNLAISILCFILLILFSKSIASYYNDIVIQKLIIVSAFGLIINAFHITQEAKMISELRFKQRSLYRLIAVFSASLIGVIAGLNGFGVWALVIIPLFTAGFITVLMWIFEGFYFKIHFNMDSFKELYPFGVNTTLSSLISSGFDNIYQILIGRYFSIIQVGFFYQAKKLQEIPGGIVNMVSQNVIFSSLSKLQDNKKLFIETFNRISLTIAVLMGLITIIIIIYAENIILMLYGEKWLGAVFYMQLLIIASFFYALENLNRVIFKVFNQTRQILYLELVKKGIQIISIFLGIYFLDLKILIGGFVISNIINYSINYYFSRKVLNNVNIFEIFNVVKICFLSFMLVLVFQRVVDFSGLIGFKTFAFLPIIIISYYSCLRILKIYNVRLEIWNLIKLLKNDK